MINRILKFSHRSIEALPAPPQDHTSSNIEYTDAVESGLRLAVYRSGRRSFRHRYTYRGRKMLMTLGEFPSVTVERARERVRANKALLAEGLDPTEERERKSQVPTFAEFVAVTFLPRALRERRSLRDIENRLKNHLLPAFSNRQIDQITRRDVTELHQKLCNKVSATTANRTHSLISSVLRYAAELDLIKENPCRGVKKAKENGARKRVLTGEELPKFMKAVEAETKTLPGMALALLISTGLRKMEVLSLRWSNIDLGQRRLFLPHTKTGVPRYVAINSRALGILEKLSARRQGLGDWVFPSDSSSGHLLDVRRTFARVCDNAKIQGLRLHDVRRTHASILVNAGVSILQVRDLLGHSDVRTTQVYAHLNTSSLESASEVAAEELRKAMEVSA